MAFSPSAPSWETTNGTQLCPDTLDNTNGNLRETPPSPKRRPPPLFFTRDDNGSQGSASSQPQRPFSLNNQSYGSSERGRPSRGNSRMSPLRSRRQQASYQDELCYSDPENEGSPRLDVMSVLRRMERRMEKMERQMSDFGKMLEQNTIAVQANSRAIQALEQREHSQGKRQKVRLGTGPWGRDLPSCSGLLVPHYSTNQSAAGRYIKNHIRGLGRISVLTTCTMSEAALDAFDVDYKRVSKAVFTKVLHLSNVSR